MESKAVKMAISKIIFETPPFQHGQKTYVRVGI